MSLNLPRSRSWDHITYLRTEHRPLVQVDSEGKAYVADTRGPSLMVFRCECGHEFSMPRASFPGRRKLKSCGRPECEFSKPPQPKPKRLPGQKGHTVSIYLHRELSNSIYILANLWDVSFNAAFNEAIRRYLQEHPIEEEQVKGKPSPYEGDRTRQLQ